MHVLELIWNAFSGLDFPSLDLEPIAVFLIDDLVMEVEKCSDSEVFHRSSISADDISSLPLLTSCASNDAYASTSQDLSPLFTINCRMAFTTSGDRNALLWVSPGRATNCAVTPLDSSAAT